MDHRASAADLEFRRAFEACEVAPQDFDHAAHVRLAYIHLCDQPVEVAAERMKRSLLAFLDHLGASRSKYHETITQAWIRAVSHFMSKPQRHLSAASFTAANPQLLDSRVMLKHYSANLLFSEEARAGFVEPDLAAIPRHR